MLDHLLGPPLHDPGLPDEEQLRSLSLRGDEKLPVGLVREKGMRGPLSRQRFRRYWGSHIAGFGKRVHDLCLRHILGTPKLALSFTQNPVILNLLFPLFFLSPC